MDNCAGAFYDGLRYIVETGLESFGRMVQNFIGLATYTDPAWTTNFPQNWTICCWAYWMVWCVAAPFFIGSTSRERTVRQVILGGYGWNGGQLADCIFTDWNIKRYFCLSFQQPECPARMAE